jgi:ubiquinone/menaquinone biosynthesis C-methylase UbiE
VFSHINEESSKYWLAELYRVLKPHGMAVVTSWGANLLALFDRLDATGKTEYDWERNIDLSFPDRAKARSEFLSGEFVFGRHGNPGDNLDPDLYGITMMPRGWVEKETSFVIEEFLDNPQVVPQATFFLRKPTSAAALLHNSS